MPDSQRVQEIYNLMMEQLQEVITEANPSSPRSSAMLAAAYVVAAILESKES